MTTNSYFWSLLPYGVGLDWLLILGALLLAGGTTVFGYWLGWWAHGRADQREPAAGSPADGAVPADAAPALGAPVWGAGAPGVTPADFPWFDSASRSVREAEQAAEIEAMVGGGR